MDARLEQLQRTLTDAISGMSAVDLNWHPPGKWCAAEVLEHLYLTYTGTVKGFERVTKAGKSQATTATWSQRWRALIVVQLGYFPEGRKSPAVAQPRGLPQEQVVPGIVSAIRQMDEMIARADATLGSRRAVLDHPILGPLTANQWRKFHLIHGRHHARQLLSLRSGSRMAGA